MLQYRCFWVLAHIGFTVFLQSLYVFVCYEGVHGLPSPRVVSRLPSGLVVLLSFFPCSGSLGRALVYHSLT